MAAAPGARGQLRVANRRHRRRRGAWVRVRARGCDVNMSRRRLHGPGASHGSSWDGPPQLRREGREVVRTTRGNIEGSCRDAFTRNILAGDRVDKEPAPHAPPLVVARLPRTPRAPVPRRTSNPRRPPTTPKDRPTPCSSSPRHERPMPLATGAAEGEGAKPRSRCTATAEVRPPTCLDKPSFRRRETRASRCCSRALGLSRRRYGCVTRVREGPLFAGLGLARPAPVRHSRAQRGAPRAGSKLLPAPARAVPWILGHDGGDSEQRR